MGKKRKSFSIRTKMYIFVIITVVAVAFGVSMISFTTGANLIDRYYKQNTAENARNFASMVDGDFLAQLRMVAETDEFQALREQAEAEDNESLIENYLRDKGLWNQYSKIRDMITSYLENMEGIKYLYIIAHGDKNADHDMYLVDDKEIPIYETGYYEERETELLGMDLTALPEPTISNGDWGWLCSDFKPVYSSDGKCVCIVGCDVGMDEVMAERRRLLMLLVGGALALTSVLLAVAVLFINKIVVNPLNRMTAEIKKFNPSENLDYEEAGVMDIDIKNRDEIGEIYEDIRKMQIRIIDYLKEKQQADNDLKNKDEQINQLSIESYQDALTGAGNKAAYIRKMDELNQQMMESDPEFALVMVDINDLKQINDEHGHRAGDLYIKGCCQMVCDAFQHSTVCRVGGDEFVAFLVGPDYETRNEAFEKLKADFIKTYEQTDVSPWLRYSAAVGMAENTPEDQNAEFVFRRADEEMYKDKTLFKEKYGSDTR